MKNTIKAILSKLNMLDLNDNISITNVIVMVFFLITAFRSLLGGSNIIIGKFIWQIQQIDISGTMPILFGLLNYAHKRSVINNSETIKKDNE